MKQNIRLVHNPDVNIIGLGYIGLPTAAFLASKGLKVFGVDINPEVVDTINEGRTHIAEKDLAELVAQSVQRKSFRAGLAPRTSKTYIIVVPTPFQNLKREPDISHVHSAVQSIIPLLKSGDLIIIESTAPVGTTEKMYKMIIRTRPELQGKLHVAYCPERVLPGNILYELEYNDRVIGGINEISVEKALEFYKSIIKGNLHPTNARTAELCKLTENASRDVQIAFANELSLICDKSDIDVKELIRLANYHPRVNILNPGCGVGGHCIAVDPYFITSDYPLESRLISQAREINNFKAYWCVEKIKNVTEDFRIQYKRFPSVALLGLAYKPNVDDLRESPALYIVNKLIESAGDETYFICEPNLKDHPLFHLTNYEEAMKKADIIVELVKHREFSSQNLTKKIVIQF